MWFLLKHITAPGFDQTRQHVSPFRMGMAALARTPWDQLAGLCSRHGVLAGYDWPPSRPTTHGERYAILRDACMTFPCITFPCIPVWTAWLTGGYLGDEDLHKLFESLGGVVTERTLGRLNAVQLPDCGSWWSGSSGIGPSDLWCSFWTGSAGTRVWGNSRGTVRGTGKGD